MSSKSEGSDSSGDDQSLRSKPTGDYSSRKQKKNRRVTTQPRLDNHKDVNDTSIEMESFSNDNSVTLEKESEEVALIEEAIEQRRCQTLINFGRGIYLTLTSSWLNFFLCILPFTFLLQIFKWSNSALFILSTLTLIPLSNLLRYSLLHVKSNSPKAVGTVIGILTRNITPMILGIFAVSKDNPRIAQATIVGNILIKLSLTYGFTYLPNIKKQFFTFDKRSNGIAISIMVISCMLLLFPVIFTLIGGQTLTETSMLRLSRWSSITILIGFAMYLVFCVKTHSNFWNIANRQTLQLSLVASAFLLLLVIGLIALESYFITLTMPGISHKWGLSVTFISSILLPSAYNAVDSVKTLENSFKEKHNTNVFIITQSVTEICLLLSPVLIVLSWIIGTGVGLNFFPFESVAIIIFVIIFHALSSNGKSTWVQGALLVAIYLILCVCLFFHPDH